MALSETIEYDKIEIVGKYRTVQVRKASVIMKDGKELTRSFQRFGFDPGTLDGSDNLVDNPLTKEPDGVTDVVHTALHIALTSSGMSVTPSGSFVNGLSTRLSDVSKVPGCNTNLIKDLVSSVPSFLMTVAFLTCTALHSPTISILSYSIDSVSAIREVLRTKLV